MKQKIQSMASQHGEPRTWGKATPSSAVSITLLVLGYCLLLVGGAEAACLTKELYAQGYEAYKDVTCIGAYAFQGYTNDVRIDRGLGKLKTIETYAFENFKGTLIFSGRFPLLTSIGRYAFYNKGCTKCKIEFMDGLPMLKSIMARAFSEFDGMLIIKGRFPSLTSITDASFNAAGNANSDIALVCRSPSGLKVSMNSFNYCGGGGVADDFGRHPPSWGNMGACRIEDCSCNEPCITSTITTATTTTTTPVFKVLGYSRTTDSVYTAKNGYIIDKQFDMLDCTVGSTYRIAPVTVDTEKESDGCLECIRYTLKNAPNGFFIAEKTGEILAVPRQANTTSADLYAVDAGGAEAYIQTIKIQIKERGEFVLRTAVPATRAESGPQFTNPTTKIAPYVVNQNYVIAALKLDASQTTLSSGGNDLGKLTYTLRDAPDSWFVNARTGKITGQFSAADSYNFSLVAADDNDQQHVVEDFAFTVVERKAFQVVRYERVPSLSRNLTKKEYTDPTSTAMPYAVDDTYRFAAIVIDKQDLVNTEDEPNQISFTLDGAPQGFLIDTKDGYIQGTPIAPGSYNMSLFAVDSRKDRALVEMIFSL